MKRTILILNILMVLLYASGFAQPATVSLPFSIGRTSCGSGTHEVHYYNYYATTNALSSAASPAACRPLLKYGGTNFTFTSSVSSVSYNPKDQNIYYFWTSYSPVTKTYAWRWPIGSCPTSSSPRLDTIRSFAYDILGVAFDKNGNGWMLEFGLTGPPYTAFLRSIDFVTGAIGQADTLNLTAGKTIYTTGTGDIAISPSGQMYFVVDNKLFTPDYASYGGAGKKITCTYIDTVKAPGASMSLVGLTYAEGKLIASYSGSGSCPYRELNPLTGDTSLITQTGTLSTTDFASVISGIGASKRLVAVNATGTPNQYDVIYDVYVQNYGSYPLTSVQVTDNLANINGAGNVSNVSISLTSNPAGVTLNGAYDGVSNTNLLAAGQTLTHYPVAQNNFTVRISCRLSNIQSGIIYNNSAVATATGFNSVALRDSSTNGSYPDLNSNDKPDDMGEAVPTPLLVAITPQTPPCASLSQTLYLQDFGTGANAAAFPAGLTAYTEYTGTTSYVLGTDFFTLVQNAQTANTTEFISLTDHAGSGRMMVVNADAANSVFYRDTVNILCSGQQYSLIFYAAFIGNSTYQTICNGFGGFKYPKVKMRIRDAVTGLVVTEISTSDITATSWNQYGMKWVMPAGISSVVFELINDGLGGCGNDIAIDDIQLGTCDALPVVSLNAVTSGCLGGSSSFTASLSDPGAIPGTIVYQWQISTDGSTWSDISGATSATYTIASTAAGDIGKYYRVMVAASGNLSVPSCRYISPAYLLTAKTPSVAAVAANKNKGSVCPGTAVTLTVTGGTLGTNAAWVWYSGSCGGTLVGSGASVSVNPVATTTYYVRAEGDCNTTACVSVTVTIACDIDDDDDGITDLAESGGVDPLDDDDADGVPNYLDTHYPGFIDANSDGVNDNFDNDKDGIINELDLDSDNDGTPDVVEADGVDANGDGKIDNYSDTDGDGLSQNVDANNTGAAGSGNGLGATDTDGDGIANEFDLDSDNDGIPDVAEALGTDSNNDGKADSYTDTDGDGFNDAVDGDIGNDGIAEHAAATLLRTGADGNGDGRADSYPYKNFDSDGRANAYDLDSDNDGISDAREAGFGDNDSNGFSDGTRGTDGWDDAVDARVSLALANTDVTGNPDYLDIDADDDGIPDNVEALPTLGYQFPTGLDSDNDGLDNAYDAVNGFGGNGITPNDQDADSVPDYRDSDTDSDGIIDRIEGNDYNLNTLADDLVSLTGVDTDGDGLDDRFDTDNSSIKGTSRYMGAMGSLTGDPSPGSNTMVQRSTVSFERDWRLISYLLELRFISLTGHRNEGAAQLQWTVSSSEVITGFIVEKSYDGMGFVIAAELRGPGTACEQQVFSWIENTALHASAVYYRITAIGANGKRKTSTILRLGSGTQELFRISPNPASTELSIVLYATRSSLAEIQVLDAQGRLMLANTETVEAGQNAFLVKRFDVLAAGTYTVKIRLEGIVHTQQVVIQK